nr:MAG TPA: hypothetical protein [Caudoviricetes sp.]
MYSKSKRFSLVIIFNDIKFIIYNYCTKLTTK